MIKIRNETIYYLLLIIYIFNQVLSESQYIKMPTISLVLVVVRYFVLVTLIIYIFEKMKISSRWVLLFGIFILFSLLNLILVDGGISYFAIILFSISSRNCSLEKIFRYTLYSLIGSHLFVVLSACIGILNDNVEFRYIGKFSGSVLSGAYYRHSMGFLVHNQVPVVCLIIYLYIIILKRNRIKITESIAFLALNYIVFKYFGSRVVFILMFLAIASYYLIKIHKDHRKKKILPFLTFIYLIAAALSVVSACLYKDNVLWNKVDMIFNNRIRMAGEAFRFYGVGLIGSGSKAVLYNSASLINVTLDNGYINVLIGDGLIIFLFILGMWTYITFIAEKHRNKYLLLVLCLMALENLINTHLGSFKLIPFFCILANPDDPFLRQAYCSNMRYGLFCKKIKRKQ